jgi:hypothetical protein
VSIHGHAARCALAGALLLSIPAAAAPAWPPLTGTWRGPYRLQDRPLELAHEWTPVLAGRFLELRHAVHAPGAPGPVFSAVALYHRPDSAGADGVWFDSGGQQRPVRLRGEAPAWTADWGTPETERGRTVYRMDGDSALVVVDSVLTRAGAWREFGTGRLRRVPR